MTIYFVERNGIPMAGTARETEELAIALRDHLQQQCATDRFYNPNDLYTVGQVYFEFQEVSSEEGI